MPHWRPLGPAELAVERLAGDFAAMVAGRAGAATLQRPHLALRVLPGRSLPEQPGLAVLSVDDFALRRGCQYTTLHIDAVTHHRVDVLPDRRSETLARWLREHVS